MGGRRDFTAGLHGGGLSVIAEIKRASPAKGPIAPDLDPPRLARAYERGGAAAISVLTDRRFFQGDLADLAAARAAASLPILRKDFIIDTYQVAEAAWAGADAVLLIAACLPGPQLQELYAAARDLGLAALVEVRTAGEMERAAALGAEIIGINNRDLATLAVDPGTAARLLPMAPPGAIVVAESGIADPRAARALAGAGADAILVGEALVKSTDPAALIRQFREHESHVR